MIRFYAMAAVTAALTTGCATKEATADSAPLRLRFPVVLTKADADENQLQLEQKIIERVAMQSAYPRCETAEEYPCVVLSAERPPRLYGIEGLRAEYYAKPGTPALKAHYKAALERTQSGRAYWVSLKSDSWISGGDAALREDAEQLDAPRPARVCP